MVIKNNIKRVNNLIGQIFTPKYVANFMVNNVLNFITKFNKNPQDLKVLEPSVGKGIFLKPLLQNNFLDITAYEMDKNLKHNLLKNYPQVNFYFENFLGSDPNEKFDIIIGNPPYLGQNYNAEIFQAYVRNFPICKKYFVGNMDLFYYFIHLGILKLKPGGILSFITTNYWITKSRKTGIKLLKPHILNECFLLQYIDLSRLKLFKGAEGQHNCIFVLQKKTEEQKSHNSNMPIEVMQFAKKREISQSDKEFNKNIFADLILKKSSQFIKKYQSALSNNDLNHEGSWNLLYPEEVKVIIEKIKSFCKINSNISYLKDFFLIRNGIIFIKDDIFILTKSKNLNIENQEFSIKINNKYVQLSEKEKKRLKKIYKSKSIIPYGFHRDDYIGYAIYFNKNELYSQNLEKRNRFYEKNYPVLTEYLKQYEEVLKNVLINAKENPKDLYFPRRGLFLRNSEKNQKEELLDLEPLYDNGKKIFFKFISNKNIFGYSNDPYYATSDTYFLWPRNSEKEIDYLFILAYLNSKIITFVFKAKNISIKRSKTKLEYELLIPNIYNFESEEALCIIELIKLLTRYLIKIHRLKKKNIPSSIKQEFIRIKNTSYFNNKEILGKIEEALETNNYSIVKNLIDALFCQLFNLNQKEIENLIHKYYT